MNDLLKKLNVLVKSSINDVLGEDWAVGGPRRKPLTPDKLGKNIDREIATLRARVNEALAYEDELQARVRQLSDEVARLDQQADEAIATGNDAAGRYAIEQMQRAQQRQTMAEADLREHQLVTQELIQRVNMLEAAVADTRRSQPESTPLEPSQTQTPGIPNLADVLRDVREKIGQMSDMIAAKDAPLSTPQSAEPTDPDRVEDSLAERRQRLSKPK